MQVDYGKGAPTRVPGSDRYRKPRPVRGHFAVFPVQLPVRGLEVQLPPQGGRSTHRRHTRVVIIQRSCLGVFGVAKGGRL